MWEKYSFWFSGTLMNFYIYSISWLLASFVYAGVNLFKLPLVFLMAAGSIAFEA